jgi:hypothetical protein
LNVLGFVGVLVRIFALRFQAIVFHQEHHFHGKHLVDVMIYLLATSAIYRVFSPSPTPAKEYNEIGICCFFTKHTAKWSKIKDGFNFGMLSQ